MPDSCCCFFEPLIANCSLGVSITGWLYVTAMVPLYLVLGSSQGKSKKFNFRVRDRVQHLLSMKKPS